MLTVFNGAELFIMGIPMITIFGLALDGPAPSNWYIDEFTRKWRLAGNNREKDFAIAMTNYGGLILLNNQSTTREWNISQGEWDGAAKPIGDWMEGILAEGEKYLNEA